MSGEGSGMRIYRNNYTADANDGGSSYHRTRAEAIAAFDEQQEEEDTYSVRAELIVVHCTTEGILAGLNRYASHNDNG
jgi:hypothetical protein